MLEWLEKRYKIREPVDSLGKDGNDMSIVQSVKKSSKFACASIYNSYIS